MKKLTLRTRQALSFFELPVEFVDTYLADASELELKVYLYLVRSALDPAVLLSVSELADRFDVTPNKVMAALRVWAEKGLLSLGFSSDGELTDLMLLPVRKAEPVPAVTETVPAEKVREAAGLREAAKVPAAAPAFDLSLIMEEEGFSDILALAEYYLKKPVTSTMREALGTVYLLLDKKADVVEYLLEDCIDRGKTSPQYMKAVAQGWKDEGLTSIEEIRARNAARNKTVYSVMSEFGIRNREPAKAETDYITAWAKDFELPVILEACRRTISAVHAPDFKYANGILSRWKAEGVTSLGEIGILDERRKAEKKETAAAAPTAKKTAFHNFPERHTDYDAIFREREKARGAV